MAGEDGEGAIELFGEEDAGEFVRHGESGERKLHVRLATEVVGKTFGVAAEEDEFAGAAVAEVTEPASELRGGELLAGGVEEDERGGGVDLEIAECGGRGVAELSGVDGAVVADAEEIVVEKGADFGATGFAEHEETDLHGRKTKIENRK
jgi:hypothetical protein